MFSVVACWSGLRWFLEQTAVVSTSEESAHSDTHTEISDCSAGNS